MDRIGRLVLAVLLISASSCAVEGKVIRYITNFVEMRLRDITLVLKPPEHTGIKGMGWVQHNVLSSTPNELPVATDGGLYFHHSEDAIEYMVTITFSKHLEGIFNGSSINVRGLWNLERMSSLDNQELAIVGGQGGLRGASGSVYYKKILASPQKYLVTCDIYIDDSSGKIPKTIVNLETLYKLKKPTESVDVSPETTESESVDVSPETTESDDVLAQVVGPHGSILRSNVGSEAQSLKI